MRMSDVMRAEEAGKDLCEGPYGIHVLAMKEDGSLYELGSVSETVIYQNTQVAHMMIERIKFAKARGEI